MENPKNDIAITAASKAQSEAPRHLLKSNRMPCCSSSCISANHIYMSIHSPIVVASSSLLAAPPV